ncbi:MAG: zinc metalloprotease HtpX [Candidatus Liptonbacteria bacterium CG11_big_fil_rev_8_21_14_0_20_35_14]|uniref:Protease HtpX homolog n=1 Tax=Candidatus Liptonbacteria bacterium CG11_big_fil_rev_8_21_14_0_20_35_14 TaxID=1974634 RepID=A0A2H0N9U5_9BACT|nr:MAG: zinc metalloprotease HtpX [Candidatus Liptonbacteria bacterium CG11_big_fil_rev_8_21_14_0_20_35_14]
MNSLYRQRDVNIYKTWGLFIVFILVVIGIGFVFAQAFQSSIILYVAVGFSIIMNILGYWYSDKIVLSMAHAKEVSASQAPELYRIVENLAITAGLPTPKVYIINESQPNAFATGRNPKHAVVAVTTGLLDKLDRSELEGVIAHELAHIGNRDMLLSTAVVVLVGFLSILADMFMHSMWFGSFRDNDDNKAGVIFMVLAIVFSIIAPIVAMILQLAISRKREFLADATGALLTRYPEGLAGALEKISANSSPMRVVQNSTAHLWVADPFRGKKTPWFHKLFMTHPPVEERLKALRGMSI